MARREHPALFAHLLGQGRIECRLCAHYCRLEPGQTGACRVRHNRGGELVTSVYGRPVALLVEPVEKKYLFHVWPGSRTLSLGTVGCNFICDYCINWRVSQSDALSSKTDPVSPQEVVETALLQGVEGIAFTYNEPTIFFEFAEAVAQRARQAGLFVVAKSNGYMAPRVLERMAGWLDAINIDLKGWRETPHRRHLGGALSPVVDNLRRAKGLGLWLEVSTLVVPGLNDSAAELRGMARFLAAELGAETPWHLQRFFPQYRRSGPPTAQNVLRRAVEIAREEGLRHIYNKELDQGRAFETRCAGCGTVLVARQGFRVRSVGLVAGGCPACGRPMYGVGLGDSWRKAPWPRENQTRKSLTYAT